MEPKAELHRELWTFAEELRDWAALQVTTSFAMLDLDDLRGTWPPLAERLIALHQGVVTSALDALDGFMMLAALNTGFLYYVPWQEDMPDRPDQLPSGADAEKVIGGQIGMILYGIKNGLAPQDAAAIVERRVAGMISTEPHTVIRRGMRARVIADMKAHGR